MNIKSPLKRRDRVRIRLAGSGDEWTMGLVMMASYRQPSSVFVLLVDGMVRTSSKGLIGGGIPLTVDYHRETVKSLFGDEYEVEVGR